MELLDLPLEVLRIMLERCVVKLDLCEGIKLRLVCSKWPSCSFSI